MQIVKRKSCRAILFTPEQKILLLQIHNPDGSWVGWITPGGGMADDEAELTALKRELLEETGFNDFEIGPLVWKRFHSFPWRGSLVEQHEVYYFIPTPEFSPNPHLNPDAAELLELKGFRWWSLDDLKKSNENFAPRKLYHLLNDLHINGCPRQPIETGP